MSFVVTATSSKKFNKPYLARLTPEGREWAKRRKFTGTQYSYRIEASPFDVFECRVGHWNPDIGQHEGGRYWFTINKDGELKGLRRDEAFALAQTLRITGEIAGETTALVKKLAEIMLPSCIRCAPEKRMMIE